MSSTVTVVNLAQTFLQGPNISHELYEAIGTTLSQGKKVLLFFNRRGYGRAVICQDCGHHWKCPYCDISLSYHVD